MADKIGHQVVYYVSLSPGVSHYGIPDAEHAQALVVEVSADIFERAFDSGRCHVELLGGAGNVLLPGIDLVRDAQSHLPSNTSIGIGLTTPGRRLGRGYVRLVVPLLVDAGATVRITNQCQAGDVDELFIEAQLLL